ncbi:MULTISPECIES: hypothetical protein [unclassified Algoriphagus]|uniref:hypothetical protein n=1 Tax=unclassified Algoriphagus TaxID=2641541 RepID=UPI000C3CF320|nr:MULTISPECIES: hypothetical protein [unclassified Algoriphagus]MAL14129.1 hypothetical protein [Algoriphagus sp.]MAN87706.1 hypothetical protein [Algoriphagus sp.]QYH37888.1 hypothetical protein GYM62_03415 [Algoriphagus sp. NBT04N3]HAS59766.1 hypothetical protein [Algoriphagus sp.]
MSTKIALKSSHIYLDAELVTTIFGEIHFAYVTYVEEQKKILITPVSSQWFVKMYKSTQFLLKSRNLKGDKTLAVREILIDNDLDASDRELDYEIIEKTDLIKISV